MPDEWRGRVSPSRFPALSIFKWDYSPKLRRLFENDLVFFLAPVGFLKMTGFLKCRQKCKKPGTLKQPRAAITTNQPIQSELDYRLDLAVSIDMLV